MLQIKCWPHTSQCFFVVVVFLRVHVLMHTDHQTSAKLLVNFEVRDQGICMSFLPFGSLVVAPFARI